MTAKHASVEDRFWRYVSPEPNSDCWLWTGSVDGHGYGQLSMPSNKKRTATHVSLEISGRPRPGIGVDASAIHSCDIPCCVNPDHLRWGSHRENMLDCRAKNRADESGLLVGQALARKSKASRPEFPCDHCGKPHKPSTTQIRNNKHFFCSRECSVIWQKANYTGNAISSWCGDSDRPRRVCGFPIREVVT